LARSKTSAEVIAALAWIVAAVSAGAETLEFRRHGQPVATRTLADLRAIAPAETVRVLEPYEEREASFRALPLAAVLDAVYGASWRTEDELLFTCRDGYQPTVPVARVLAHRAWLAFERPGAPAFTIRKFESGRRQDVSIAPFYLIWDNVNDARVRAEGDYGWPYQLVGVELIRSRERFPNMAPPASAPAEVQRGFAAFRIHCSRCHTVNGEGGRVGPELNAPDRAAGRREPGWLRLWISDPNRVAPGTRMEPLNPALPDRDAVIASIIAYLQAIAPPAPAPDA
jgi:mono/diheme cytochrome c family protein